MVILKLQMVSILKFIYSTDEEEIQATYNEMEGNTNDNQNEMVLIILMQVHQWHNQAKLMSQIWIKWSNFERWHTYRSCCMKDKEIESEKDETNYCWLSYCGCSWNFLEIKTKKWRMTKFEKLRRGWKKWLRMCRKWWIKLRVLWLRVRLMLLERC